MKSKITITMVLIAGISSAQFGPKQTVSNSVNWARTVHGADLDGDGDNEFLAGGQNSVIWHENTGGGNFGSIQYLPYLTSSCRDITAADIDGDSDLDIVACGDGTAAWLENLGSGNFGASWNTINSTLSSINTLKVADMDGDGDLDVVLSAEASHSVSWCENQGGGVFAASVELMFVTSATSLDVADMDNDGDMDVVGGGYTTVRYVENLGGGSFANFVQILDGTMTEGVTSIHLSDLDGDGYRDVLGASYADEEIYWVKNNGNSTFGTKNSLITFPGLYNIYPSVNSMDLDGDGDNEVFFTIADHISWMNNLGGTFGPEMSIGTAEESTGLELNDMNGDGKRDVMAAAYSSSAKEVFWFGNQVSAGVNELAEGSFAMWPNPGNDFIHIETEGNAFTVSIWDQSGKLMMMKQNESAINISALYSGVYIVEIRSEEGSSTCQKLVKL